MSDEQQEVVVIAKKTSRFVHILYMAVLLIVI